MKIKLTILIPLLCLGFALVGSASVSAQRPRPQFEGKAKLNFQQMRAWFERTSPSKAHQALGHLKGSWRAEGKVWMMPDLPPMTLTGESHNRWILGDRFVESRFTGEAGGVRFEGVATDGYDNAAGHYVATWKDSMNTAVLYFSGQSETVTEVVTDTDSGTEDAREVERRVLTAPGLDPLTGEPVTVKGVTTHLDDDHYRYESYVIDAEGAEVKMLEILFTRDLKGSKE
jgi:hypothetical protein